MTEITVKEMCDSIAAELQRRGITVRNSVTGRVVRTGQDVYEFSSRGELTHIPDWHQRLFPTHPLWTTDTDSTAGSSS